MAASRNPRPRPEHVCDEIRALTAATAGVDRDACLESYILRRTADHAILIVSEAIEAVPIEMADRHPGHPWADTRGIGDVLRHGCYAVDAHVLENILTAHLPILAPTTDRTIADGGGQG